MSDSTVTIVGSLGKDPELRYTTGGQALASMTVAVGHRYKKGDDWVEETAWVDVTCWAQLAENASASLSKGARVIVTGRLKADEWEDRETGKKRSKLTLVADEIGPSLRWATCQVERIERDKV